MEYPWPSRRYFFNNGKPPSRRKPRLEPTETDYRQLLMEAVPRITDERLADRIVRVLSRGVPKNGEQG